MREDIAAMTKRELERYQVLARCLRKELRQAEAGPRAGWRSQGEDRDRGYQFGLTASGDTAPKAARRGLGSFRYIGDTLGYGERRSS
jgi:hypothetical protein